MKLFLSALLIFSLSILICYPLIHIGVNGFLAGIPAGIIGSLASIKLGLWD